MELTQNEIKRIMNNWVNGTIAEYREKGIKLNRAKMAQQLDITQSCFSQYLNPSHPKAAPWEFQHKLAEMLNKSIRELHPELIDLSLSFAA